MSDNENNQKVQLDIQQVPMGKSEEWLLNQRGWFFINDFFKIIKEDGDRKYKQCLKLIKRIIDNGNDPYKIMGRKKFGKRVVINMDNFAPWYRNNLILKAKKIDGRLDFKNFISNKDGIFRLSEVCNYYRDFLPYSYSILKRTAEKCEDSMAEIGVVKYDTTFLVVMPRFGRWLRSQIIA